jgi:hypothetical protein
METRIHWGEAKEAEEAEEVEEVGEKATRRVNWKTAREHD